ncbi:hypothetical protein ASG25_21460 [Rhizobium sp. Leaf384]|uniref:hypothetical protein n=1 Tax=Rhizobium sp. Leaf384 TaxID=1736358 RepID=UPI000714D41A|nr:hypothetical protein [Rhizobium sp. Leaf384]KQS74046.1 hypothetical protein ASG25_21460 [Rhizobium sp. Leaf384]
MSHLPIVELLADAQDNAERAAWLLAAPVCILVREMIPVRAILRSSGCQWGVHALDIEVACDSARRDPKTGEVPAALLAARTEARQGLIKIAHGDAQRAAVS